MPTNQQVYDDATKAAQKAAETIGGSYSPTTGFRSITSEQLQPAVQPPQFQQPAETAIPDISKILSGTMEMTKPEQQAQDITTQLLGMNDLLAGKSADVLSAEQQAGLPELAKQQTDLQSQLNAIINEQQAIPMQIQQEARGQGLTAGGVAPLQAARLRENAIKALTTNSLLQSVQGNIATARASADRAIALKYEPLEAKQKALMANLEIIQKSPAYTQGEKARALKQQLILDERTRMIETQKETEKGIQNISMTLAQYGADPTLVKGAKTIDEAIMKAGGALQDPKAKLDLQKIKLDIDLANEKILTEQKQRRLLGEKTPAEIKAEKEALKTAEGQINALSEKVSLIDYALVNPGMTQRVGTNRLSRQGYFIGIPGIGGIGSKPSAAYSEMLGEGQQFAGAVQNLTNKEFIDTLVGAKVQGATFGALNEQEGTALKTAATRINSWEIKDDKNNPTGYWNIDEKTFKEELNRIKTLANKAILRSKGSLLTEEEKALIQSNAQESTSASDYFNE